MKIAAMIFLLSLAGSILGQGVSFQGDAYKNIIGVKSSSMTGHGAYFHRKFSENYSVRVNGFVYYYFHQLGEDNDPSEKELSILYNAGLELQRDLYKAANTRIYGFLGGYRYYEKFKDEYQNHSYEERDSYKYINVVGLGIGSEYIVRKRFCLDFDFGFKFNDESGRNEGLKEITRALKLGIGVAVGFMF